jgi:hypothetical protein
MIVARFHEMTGQWAVLEETEEPSLSLTRRRGEGDDPLGM